MEGPFFELSKMLEDVAGLEGGYRLLNNQRVTFEALQRSHRQRTAERAKEIGTVVVVHDTTEVQTPDADACEVGHLNSGRTGYLAHLSLAQCVEPNRPVRPLGVLNVETIHRKERGRRVAKGSSGAETARLNDRESLRWERGVVASAQALQECSVVHVMDREADSYTLFCLVEQLEQGFVIRLRNDRRAPNRRRRG